MKELTMKPIEGFEHYSISECGTKVLNNITNKYLSICDRDKSRPSTYKVVNLYDNYYNKILYIHRIVAKAYLPNPNNYPIVNHKDGNKHNNHYTNLEWCTCSQNHIHAYSTGIRKCTENQVKGIKQMHESGILCKKVININTGEVFKSIGDAAKSINTPKGVLCRKLKGQRKNNTSMRYYNTI